jgi:Activator of Hsp90 ATPase homolog 1-like protein
MSQRLSHRIQVALPAEEAFQLFTPRGEREWADDWDPTFPAPTSDDSAPGTVFETKARDHQGTWLVTDRVWGRRIAYAQVMPGDRAGTITITLEATEGGSEVEVVYELTPLSETGAHHLEQFAGRYCDYLRSWQDAIAACLEKRSAV